MNESELAIAELEEHISLGNAMQRLNNNKDFKKLFVDGFMKKTSEDIGKGYCLLDDKRRERAIQDLYAISFFHQYCDMLIDNGGNAVHALEEERNMIKVGE